jgi:hypothetical protein
MPEPAAPTREENLRLAAQVFEEELKRLMAANALSSDALWSDPVTAGRQAAQWVYATYPTPDSAS